MNPGHALIGGAAALAFAMLAITTAFHYEALRFLERAALLAWSGAFLFGVLDGGAYGRAGNRTSDKPN